MTAPGQDPKEVREWPANDMGHCPATAVQALNIGVGLDRPGAARLLVIVSDGKFRTEESTPAQKVVARLIKSGCAVLWIAVGEKEATPFDGAKLVRLTDPSEAAAVIGKAAVEALRNA